MIAISIKPPGIFKLISEAKPKGVIIVVLKTVIIPTILILWLLYLRYKNSTVVIATKKYSIQAVPKPPPNQQIFTFVHNISHKF